MSCRLLLCLLLAQTAAAHARTPPPPAEGADGGRYIVRLHKEGVDARQQQSLAHGPHLESLDRRGGIGPFRQRALSDGLVAIELPPGTDASTEGRLVDQLRQDPNIRYIVPDERRHAHALPVDPLYASQWYLQGQAPAAGRFDEAWDTTTGAGDTVIAVLDSGVRFEHPDLGRDGLGGRLLPGRDFISGESSASFLVANDGDGWDDDPSDPGDWIDQHDRNSTVFSDCELTNSTWHGTRVTGLLGAVSNNGEGVSATNWNARILPVRVLGKCGGRDSDIIAAARWAAGLPVPGVPPNPHPAHIINLSLGAEGSCQQPYLDLVSELSAAGVLVVASAGNEQGAVHAPANCPGVLAVAGLRHAGAKVGYSSFGQEIGIAAPAGNCVTSNGPCQYEITTTTMNGTRAPVSPAYTNPFKANVGTSFAAPLVAGIAGLMHAVNDSLYPHEVIQRMQSAARPFTAEDGLPSCPQTSATTGQCNCTMTTCGAGVADAAAAVREAIRPVARIALTSAVVASQPLTLDGSSSAAARDATLSAWRWEAIAGPNPFIGSTDLDHAVVELPADTSVTVRLVVTDSMGRDDSTEVILSTLANGAHAGGGGGGNTAGGGGGGGGGGTDACTLLGAWAFAVWRRRRQRYPSACRRNSSA